MGKWDPGTSAAAVFFIVFLKFSKATQICRVGFIKKKEEKTLLQRGNGLRTAAQSAPPTSSGLLGFCFHCYFIPSASVDLTCRYLVLSKYQVEPSVWSFFWLKSSVIFWRFVGLLDSFGGSALQRSRWCCDSCNTDSKVCVLCKEYPAVTAYWQSSLHITFLTPLHKAMDPKFCLAGQFSGFLLS